MELIKELDMVAIRPPAFNGPPLSGSNPFGQGSGYQNSPVRDLTLPDMQCNVLGDIPAPDTIDVVPGDIVSFEWGHESRQSGDDIIASSHVGAVLVYISPNPPVPDSWVKLFEEGEYAKNQWAVVPKLTGNKGVHSVRIPAGLAPGNYLLRPELITLHEAEVSHVTNKNRGNQLYMECIQIHVSGNGQVTLPKGVSFPGAYSYSDPGIVYNVYYTAVGAPAYKIPGPTVWSGAAASVANPSLGPKKGPLTVDRWSTWVGTDRTVTQVGADGATTKSKYEPTLYPAAAATTTRTTTNAPITTTTTRTTTNAPVPTTTTAAGCTYVTVTGGEETIWTTLSPQTVTVTAGSQQQTTTTTTSNGGSSNCAAKYQQCGGQGYTGPTCCQSGSTCRSSNQYIYASVSTNANFNIAIPSREAAAFRQSLLQDPTVFYQMLATIRSENSYATDESDLTIIHKAIQEGVGFKSLDRLIFTVISRWIVDTIKSQVQKCKESGDEYGLIRWLGSLAQVYQDQGMYDEAEISYHYCLKSSLLTFGEDHPYTVACLSSLAGLYVKQGKYDAAEPLLVDSLQRRSKTLGRDHPDTLASLDNLVRWYIGQGKYDEAEPLVVECLDARRTVLGEDSLETVRTMGNLAVVYECQGKSELAGELLLDCWDRMRQSLGEDHPSTLWCANHLALSYKSRGVYEKAEGLLLDCLSARRRVLGDNHPDTLETMNDLASLFVEQGTANRHGGYQRAEGMYMECLEKRRRVLGDNHRETLTTIENLAALYLLQRQYEKAEPLLKSSLERSQTVHGVEHPETLKSVDRLAGMYQETGQFGEAESLYLTCLEEATGPAYLKFIGRLDSLYNDGGRYGKAEHLYVDNLVKVKRRWGDEHPYTLQCVLGLGRLYWGWGRFSEARLLIAEGLEKGRGARAEDDAKLLTLLHHLALLHKVDGQYERAEQLFLECLHKRELLLGQTHSDTLATKNGLAGLYGCMHKYQEAEDHYTELIQRRREILGEDDAETHQSINDLKFLRLRAPANIPSETVASTVNQPDPQPNTLNDTFPLRGVRLSFFATFIDECGGRQRLRNLTTKQVCSRFVTSRYDNSKSVCEQLEHVSVDGSPIVGTAVCFISHCWQNNFLEVVDAVTAFFIDKGTPDVIVWFDLFSLPQGSREKIKAKWLMQTFTNTVSIIHNVRMVLTPWKNPTALKRAWCVYELFAGATREADFDVAIPPSEIGAFCHSLAEDPGLFQDVLSTLKSENCIASEDDDLKAIQKAIRKTVGGFNALDRKVLSVLSRWMLSTLESKLEVAGRAGQSEEHARWLFSLSRLHHDQGMLEEAKTRYEDCLDMRKQVMGGDHVQTLVCASSLAEVYHDMGQYERAELAYMRCWEVVEGNAEKGTLRNAIISGIAELYNTQGYYAKAEDWYLKLVQTTRRERGDDDPVTLVAISNLAFVSYRLGKGPNAESKMKESLNKLKHALGEDHRDTIKVASRLAALYHDRGENEEAEMLYKD
ncbi:hypothetical protein HDV00_001655 [Rhizophlyctis rosea]|nr:hypothetical protein HDV00_001655 [Rhizophlyctis rosea]